MNSTSKRCILCKPVSVTATVAANYFRNSYTHRAARIHVQTANVHDTQTQGTVLDKQDRFQSNSQINHVNLIDTVPLQTHQQCRCVRTSGTTVPYTDRVERGTANMGKTSPLSSILQALVRTVHLYCKRMFFATFVICIISWSFSRFLPFTTLKQFFTFINYLTRGATRLWNV